jgi:hypothetical protein
MAQGSDIDCNTPAAAGADFFLSRLRGRVAATGSPPGLTRHYTSRVLLIVVAVVLAVFALIRIGRTFEPRQRVVFALVVVVGLIYLLLTLVRFGILGRGTPDP